MHHEGCRHLRPATTAVPARPPSWPLRLIDLGDTGARLETHARLSPGQQVELRIDDSPFAIPGRVTRLRFLRFDRHADRRRPVFEAALDFEPLPRDARRRLAGLMSWLADLAVLQRLPPLRLAAG